jgi:hypothetical protein
MSRICQRLQLLHCRHGLCHPGDDNHTCRSLYWNILGCNGSFPWYRHHHRLELQQYPRITNKTGSGYRIAEFSRVFRRCHWFFCVSPSINNAYCSYVSSDRPEYRKGHAVMIALNTLSFCCKIIPYLTDRSNLGDDFLVKTSE